ncbi:MAG TPA: ABC transporter permease [Candidatus Angelobacter sp.]|nr:ABC transporter permease [Candidatus Angelobacter sp.]
MLLRRLREMIGGAGKRENDTADELHFHLEKEIEQNIARGMTPEEARRRALIAFGGVDQTREALRAVHRGRLLEALRQDLRYGWRMLRKTPGFTAVAVVTLALGIGANTAIFSLIDAIIFRSMPIADPQSLLVLEWQAHKGPGNLSYRNFGDCDESHDGATPHGCSLSLPFFKQVQAESGVFSHVAAYTAIGQLDMSGNGPARMVKGEFVTGDYFPTLGVQAHSGRLINAGDDGANAPAVAVLNYGFWQTEFGGVESAIGKTVRLNGVPFQIIGITDPRFDALTLSNKYDMIFPMAQRPAVVPNWKPRDDLADHWWLLTIGRLKPGVSASQAEAGVSLLFRNSISSVGKPLFKPDSDPRIKLAPATQVLGGTQKQALQPLYVMMLCVGAVLLIACANVAGLLLARSAVREREIAVRLAMGAKRSRIVLQFLTESLMLAVAGGALGLLVALWGARALMAMVSAGTPNPPIFSPQLDWRVLGFTAGISLLTGILFGLAPALRWSDVSLTSSLKSTESGAIPGARGRQRRFTAGGALVAVQVALAIVVLVTAGLLVRTLNNLKSLNPGFDAQNVLLFGIDPRLAGYKGAQIDQLFIALQEKFAAIPGVTSATYSWIPFLSGGLWTTGFHRPGTPPPTKAEFESGAAEKNEVESDAYAVGPKFFSTWRIPFQSGRDFTAADFAVAAGNERDNPSTNPTPVIVNQEFARQYFPGKNPLGQIFGEQEPSGFGDAKAPGYLIVGMVANSKYNSLRREIKPVFYQPNVGGQAYFALRTGTDPLSLVPTIKNLVNQQSQDLAVFRISTETEAIERQVFTEKMTARLSSLFGILALLLACLGLYGLLSYEVTRRTREIGIRMAVGARQHNVIRLVLGKAVWLIVAGAIVGIGAALLVTRLLTSFLYGVKAGDPVTLAAVATLLGVVALAACYIPARRATRVDPLVALRYE